ncbi:MAG: CHAT domain-containing protein [Pseudonocardiales bacterium]|nr:CHAT domain-containing protein [Pseudonocardiales bacterium]
MVVEEFAEQLRRDGIDAWYDGWEIAPGDDIVAKMDEGVDRCGAGLLFVSHAWFEGPWVQDEYTSLAFRKVEDDIRLVPVLLDDVADSLPTRLRKLARRSVEDYAAIRDTLLGIDRKPGLGNALEAHTRSVTIRLEDIGQGRARVSLLIDGHARASETDVRVPSGLRLSSGGGLAAFAELRKQVSSLLLPGEVGQTVEQVLGEIDSITVVDLHIETSLALASLPFEAALTPAGSTPVLRPEIRMRRSVIGKHPDPVPPAPGPLKILVAVGAPDENKTPQARLDIEAEMGSILDAVAPAVRDGRAEVRILEVANTRTIMAALDEDDYHVLHLSGHGDETGIELEDEDGAPVPTRAADLADALRATGRVVPLVFLSSCHSASNHEGLALTLHQLGIPRVIAMQAPVTDRYATELAAAFYRHLSVPAFPRVGVALARARHELASQPSEQTDQRRGPQWATATLTATEDGPLIDGDLELVPLRRAPVHLASGPVPALGVGELIGRRVELRETLRTLRDDGRSVVLTGIGGVGKSSVAGRVMARLAEQGWVCSATSGKWSLDTVCAALRDELLAARTRQRWARDLHEQLAALPADDHAWLWFLQRVLRQHPLVLVLDNFEDNLTGDGAAFIDPGTSSVIEHLAESCGAGRLLVTSRYPLPGMQDLLWHRDIGPLSQSETRRLFLRLPGLRTLSGEDAALVHRLIGGHPQVLEFLDALRRHGASTEHVRRKFRDLARKHHIDLTQTRELHEDVAAAVQLGARDICLNVLLAALDDAEKEVLLQTAVSSLPVTVPDLTPALDNSELDDKAIERTAQRLADLSLIVCTDEGLWVHRWTAEGLRESQPPDGHRARCRRAGELRLGRIASSRRDVSEGIEAAQNFLEAQDWDRATEVATGVADFLARDSNLRRLSFAAQVLARLPPEHGNYHLFVDHEAGALTALGLTGEAVKRYRHLVKVFTERVQAEPDRADYQRDLSISYERLGDLSRALGQGEQALNLYQQSLHIRERLAHAEPDRADYQRDLSISYERLGDLSRALGQGEQALNLYQQSLTIAERLAHAEPDRADYQRDLSISHQRLGRCFAELDRSGEAAASLERHLQLALDVYQRSPGQVDAVVDLAIALHLAAGFNDDGDERNRQAQELLGALEADQRLPSHGQALLDNLRGDQNSAPRREV